MSTMNGINIIPGMYISSSGLNAERVRMEVAANNLANSHSTRNADGSIYQRQVPVFAAVMDDMQADPSERLKGVEVDDVLSEDRPPLEIYAPYNPQANESGMVEQANIQPIEEMLDLITASRAYEANLSALKQSRDLAEKTISLGRS